MSEKIDFKPLVKPEDEVRYLAVPTTDDYKDLSSFKFYEVLAVIPMPSIIVPLVPSEKVDKVAAGSIGDVYCPISVKNNEILHVRIRSINFPILLFISYLGPQNKLHKTPNYVAAITVNTEDWETEHFIVKDVDVVYTVFNPWDFDIPSNYCSEVRMELYGWLYHVAEVKDKKLIDEIIQKRLYKILPVRPAWG